MGEQQSGLQTWSYMQSQKALDSAEGHLPLILSAAGALGISPFAVMRYMNGEWLIAILDTLIIAGFVLLGTFVYRTKRVRFASVAISILCIAGVVVTVYLKGTQQLYWMYPALIAVFYLMKPLEAVLLATAATAFLVPRLLPGDNPMHSTTVLITIVVTSAFAYAFSAITNRQREQLMSLATRDSLTGAGNRRALEAKMAEVVASYRRSRTPASLILLDLDHFKEVNDVHGHAAGDQILRRLTEIVNLRIRVTDSLYRIGGEEFVVVVEGQDLKSASHLAEQLRTLVEANELVPDHAVTISLGVAQLVDGETPNEWLCRADEALYDAKRDGRNMTSVAAYPLPSARAI